MRGYRKPIIYYELQAYAARKLNSFLTSASDDPEVMCVDVLHLLVRQNISNEIQQKPSLHLVLVRGVLFSAEFSVLDQNPHSFMLNVPVKFNTIARFSWLGCVETLCTYI